MSSQSCNFLIDQALQRIWASPRQDVQSVTKPKRITPFNGVWNSVRVLYDTYILPEPRTKFHVYQVGQLYPLLMGFFPRQDKWIRLSDNMMQQNMIANVYSAKGIEMPRFETWYLVTPDRNLLLAVKDQPTIDIDLNTEELFFRVYSNAFFQGLRFNDTNYYIKVSGRKIENLDSLYEFKQEYDALKNNQTKTPLFFINGRISNNYNTATVKVGDIVEYVEDKSIRMIADWRIQGLPTFDSILDAKRKYLLHYRTVRNISTIDYNDDIDVYVIKRDKSDLTNGNITGFYYHRNNEDAVRNLTHRDYSVPVAYVQGFTEQETPEITTNETGWYLRFYIRHSGLIRPLEYVHDRIHELYKLPDAQVRNALLGIESVVPEWRADNLEKSDYMRVMRNPDYNLTAKMVEDMFGYNAVTRLIGDTPTRVDLQNGRKSIKVPVITRRYSTGFEYDKDGLLLDYHNHVAGDRYNVRDPKAEIVEMIGGYASLYMDETYNRKYTPWDEDFGYRLYRRTKTTNNTGKWVDVTDRINSYYRIDKDAKMIEWLHDMDTYDCIVRSDKNIVVQKESLAITDGTLHVTMTYLASRYGTVERYVMEVPMGELDVFLNGYSLVEGIDYYVDFPKIYIVNKTFLKYGANDKQEVVVRSYGFPEKTLQRGVKEDIGWIRHDTLSRNNKFDIRDDRVMRITVGGKLVLRDQLGFSEEDGTIKVPGFRNGLPYEIKDIIVPLRNIVEQDHTAFRYRSIDMDNRVSDYLSQYLKDPVKTTPSSIPSLWPVYSPYCSRIIQDLRSGVLSPAKLRLHYDDNYVLEVLKPYEYLLRVDPTQDATLADTDYVKVHPTHLTTVIDLNFYQYKFVERMINLVLKDRVDLSSFARIRN